ncbi:MAG: SH3 domain-containing protein [Oscillospiraceae bacterium]|nr:SH3 domain-containing protein [Oscillospiraceae bacterium]
MRRFTLKTLLMTLLLLAVFVVSAYAEDGEITGNDVNFREGPGVKYDILGCIKKGTKVTINDRSNSSWTAVTFNGIKGYVSAGYVKVIQEQAPAADPAPSAPVQNTEAAPVNGKAGTVNAMYVRMRSGPNTNASVITSLSTGANVTVTGTTGGWSAIVYNGTAGYMYSSYITLAAETPAAPAPQPEAPAQTPETPAAPTPDVPAAEVTINAKAGYISGSKINFRKGPSTSYPVISVLNNGQECTVTGTTGSYSAVTINGVSGYVYTQYIAFAEKPDGVAAFTLTPIIGKEAVITRYKLNFRSGPDTTYAIIGELNQNDVLAVNGEYNGYYSVTTADGKSGYVYSSFVKLRDKSTASPEAAPSPTPEAAPQPTNAGHIKGNNVRMRGGASTSFDILGEYNNGTKLTILGTSGSWTKVSINDKEGYIYSTYVVADEAAAPSTGTAAPTPTPAPQTSSKGKQVADYALQFVGYNYSWGGSDPSTGFDCSGLVHYAYAHFGYSLSRVACDQAANDGILVSNDDLQPGDILCFYSGANYVGHVGIYIGNNQFVHASSSTTGVIITDLAGYYTSRGYIAKRVV